ncbi:MAG: hypothetical protein ABIV21_02275 [Pyrinomonadaceae bacterium]
MAKLLIGVLIGLIAGGAITFFTFVGVPRSTVRPGEPIKAPDANAQAGTAQIVLKQDFFNEVLGAIFRDMNDPAFQLSSTEKGNGSGMGYEYSAFQEQPQCDGKISILPTGSGVQTGLKFDSNRIAAPLAFTGNYNSIFGCIQFTGWAQANLELRFDSAQQAVFGVINVETVNLDGVNPVIGGLVTPLVQSTLNSRVNPIRILDAKQIAIDTPIASTGGRLQANVKDVRANLSENALNLFVTYDFHGTPTM